MRRNQRKASYLSSIEHFWKVFKTEKVNSDFFWTIGSPRFKALPSEKIRILIWNAFKQAAGSTFYWDYNWLAGQVDIVILQEVLIDRTTFSRFIVPGFELTHSASYRRRDGFREGLMIGANCHGQGDKKRVLSKFREPLVNTHKSALISFYPLFGQSDMLMIVNLHSTLFRSLKACEDEMNHLLRNLPDHEGPSIFAGDFNTITPKFLSRVVSILDAAGFRHVVVAEDPRSDYRLLDHVFIKDIGVDAIEVLASIKTSDHYPIIATLSVSSSQP